MRLIPEGDIEALLRRNITKRGRYSLPEGTSQNPRSSCAPFWSRATGTPAAWQTDNFSINRLYNRSKFEAPVFAKHKHDYDEIISKLINTSGRSVVLSVTAWRTIWPDSVQKQQLGHADTRWHNVNGWLDAANADGF